MRNRPRPFLPVIALIGAPLLMAADQPAVQSHVRLEITGVRSDKGKVQVCMTARPDRFPKCQGDREAHTRSVPASDTVSLDFGHVAPGRYAIAVLHDENDNGKVDRVLGMMPKEGFGFSRDAPVRMGPPSFNQASFQVSADVEQTIRMRYML
jgi:uncharacterized protein (DUF2141 family)